MVMMTVMVMEVVVEIGMMLGEGEGGEGVVAPRVSLVGEGGRRRRLTTSPP